MLKQIGKAFVRTDTGQAMVWFALTAGIMLLFGALVVDYGRPALEARRLQNAADSAALAASYGLPLGTSDSQSEILGLAQAYAGENGYVDPAQISVSLSDVENGKYSKVTATVSNTVDYSIAKLMGLTSVELSRSASAKLMTVGGVNHTVPIAIKKEAFEDYLAAGVYDMQLKFGGGGGTMGDYGAIDPDDAGGASVYSSRLIYGYDGPLSIGDIIGIENGNMSGPTRVGIAERYNSCHHSPSCTPEHYAKGCPRVMVVPIAHLAGNKKLEIDGFAPFFLTTGIVGSGNDCELYARYIPGYIVDEAETSGGGTDYGVYARKLVE